MSSYDSRRYSDDRRPPPMHSRRDFGPSSDAWSYTERRESSPTRRHTPPHDKARTPPYGLAVDHRREWDYRRDRDYARDCEDYRRSRRSPPRDYGRRGYRDRDRDMETYRSPPHYDSRSRSSSRSARRRSRSRSPYFGGPPSREVMLEGLPVDMTDEDIREELEQYHNVGTLEDVRVIRDKKTGVSRQFGFIRFPNVEASTAFIERNHPTIYLYNNNASGEDAQGTKVRIQFSRERDNRDRNGPETEWRCRSCSLLNYTRRMECFRCETPRTEVTTTGHLTHNKPSHFTNTGDRDAAHDNAPSQFLLVRGLEPKVTEEILAGGVAKLYKTSDATSEQKKPAGKIVSTTSTVNLGAQEGSVKRVWVVRDRRTDESWRYGFAEFHTVEDATAALTKFNASDKFTIASKPVHLSYIHTGVFVPALGQTEGAEKFTFSATINPALRLAYWDEEAYVSELMVSEDPPGAQSNNAFAVAGSSSVASAAAKEGLITSKEAEAKMKKRKAEIDSAPGKKKVASHLQFWSNRHAELHGIEPSAPVTETKSTVDSPLKDASFESNTTQNPPAEETLQSYADPVANCCYLCSRQFKSLAEVRKHEKASKLHADNLKDSDKIQKALAKLSKAPKAGALAKLEEEQEASSPGNAAYRDRAAERRQAFNQPKKAPAPTTTTKFSLPSNKPDNKSKDPSPEPPPPAQSKGASLLSKMGWASGQGLGAQGSGMVAPIATELYVQGVGLGAAGGRVGDAVEEADRATKGGYAEFVGRTRERAKERFERMG